MYSSYRIHQGRYPEEDNKESGFFGSGLRRLGIAAQSLGMHTSTPSRY